MRSNAEVQRDAVKRLLNKWRLTTAKGQGTGPFSARECLTIEKLLALDFAKLDAAVPAPEIVEEEPAGKWWERD